jgi:hypothetical protein
MMRKDSLILVLLVLLVFAPALFAAQPPFDVKLLDTPNDKGESITLIFETTEKDALEMVRLGSRSSVEYEIWRSAEEENSFQLVGKILSSEERFIDSEVKDGVNYSYFIKGIFCLSLASSYTGNEEKNSTFDQLPDSRP